MDTIGQISLLGVDFDDLPLPEVLDRILARPAGLPFVYVVTPNADHLARLRRRPALHGLYRAAWLCLLDSKLLGNAAAALGLRCPVVVSGADLTTALLPHLTGSTVAVIGLNATNIIALRERFPDVDWLHHAPRMRLLDHPAAFEAAAEFAVAAAARITFIALGSPLQEHLAAAIAAHPEARGIGLCIGTALAFEAGTTRRAPSWMRRAGLEWLHRLASDPRRLARRYLLDDPPVLAALLAAAIRQARQRS